MNIEIADIVFPMEFIKNIELEDKKLKVILWNNNDMEFIFNDGKSAKKKYNNITRKLKKYKKKPEDSNIDPQLRGEVVFLSNYKPISNEENPSTFGDIKKPLGYSF
ncbi:MAG: hypothetical protein EHM58_10575 [Ignavibacteriae bacterium]|nr:MAG: hypothetical protein EHM58_10575 [Ignavibacteriota bacterium]